MTSKVILLSLIFKNVTLSILKIVTRASVMLAFCKTITVIFKGNVLC
jgi:hypothetical protein